MGKGRQDGEEELPAAAVMDEAGGGGADEVGGGEVCVRVGVGEKEENWGMVGSEKREDAWCDGEEEESQGRKGGVMIIYIYYII